MKNKAIIALATPIELFSNELQAETQTYLDSQGRNAGTATTNSHGQTTYRDPQGRTTGTSSSQRR